MAFIKLDRELVQSEAFDDNEVLAVYLKLLINAKYCDCVERGTVLKRGQLKISIRKFAVYCNLSYQRTRRIFSTLERTHLIGVETDASGSIVTIFNYDCDSDFQQAATQAPTQEKRTERHSINAASLLSKENKELIREEPPAHKNNFQSKQLRSALVSIYGEKMVSRYEQRFLVWKSKHPSASADCMDCIGEWMREDNVPKISADAISGGEGDENFGHSPGFAIEKALGIYD